MLFWRQRQQDISKVNRILAILNFPLTDEGHDFGGEISNAPLTLGSRPSPLSMMLE